MPESMPELNPGRQIAARGGQAMRPRLVAVVAAGFFFVAVAYNLRGSPQQTTAAPQAPPASGAAERQAVLSKYCFMCHNEKLKSGGLALSTLDLANLSKNP